MSFSSSGYDFKLFKMSQAGVDAPGRRERGAIHQPVSDSPGAAAGRCGWIGDRGLARPPPSGDAPDSGRRGGRRRAEGVRGDGQAGVHTGNDGNAALSVTNSVSGLAGSSGETMRADRNSGTRPPLLRAPPDQRTDGEGGGDAEGVRGDGQAGVHAPGRRERGAIRHENPVSDSRGAAAGRCERIGNRSPPAPRSDAAPGQRAVERAEAMRRALAAMVIVGVHAPGRRERGAIRHEPGSGLAGSGGGTLLRGTPPAAGL